jgi:hypothetical protein
MTSDRLFSSIKLSQYTPLINPLNNLCKNWEKRVSNKPIDQRVALAWEVIVEEFSENEVEGGDA